MFAHIILTCPVFSAYKILLSLLHESLAISLELSLIYLGTSNYFHCGSFYGDFLRLCILRILLAMPSYLKCSLAEYNILNFVFFWVLP